MVGRLRPLRPAKKSETRGRRRRLGQIVLFETALCHDELQYLERRGHRRPESKPKWQLRGTLTT